MYLSYKLYKIRFPVTRGNKNNLFRENVIFAIPTQPLICILPKFFSKFAFEVLLILFEFKAKMLKNKNYVKSFHLDRDFLIISNILNNSNILKFRYQVFSVKSQNFGSIEFSYQLNFRRDLNICYITSLGHTKSQSQILNGV